MTIRIFLGNVGAAKTVCAVREMAKSKQHYFSNIITRRMKNNTVLNSGMIFKKDEVETSKGHYKEKLVVNKDFWQTQAKKYQPMNVIIDEAHSIINSRRAMSKKTQVFMDWLAMIRRVLGSVDATGDLTLISQLERRIDVIAKEMCNEVRFFVCWYMKTCLNCGYTVRENNEQPMAMKECGRCGSIRLKKHHHKVECWHFQGMDEFVRWKYLGMKRQHFRHYFILDIEKYFPLYDTLQWDNLLSED